MLGLRSLSLRGRLLVLGSVAIVALLVVTAVSLLLISNFSAKTNVNAASEKQAKTVSHAYESWIYNDDQDNMNAAVVALHDPSQITATAATMQQGMADAAIVTEESSASTEETSASSQQIAASAHELAESATVLDRLVSRFRV
jgi:methyl-accepting chemotaxis protein